MKSILPINLAFDRVVGNLAQLPFDEGIEIAVCGRSTQGNQASSMLWVIIKSLLRPQKRPVEPKR